MFESLKLAIGMDDNGNLNSKPDNPTGESANDRVTWALVEVRGHQYAFDKYLLDMRESLSDPFRLHSIEQSELTGVASAQNKAIFVFTAVTIIFLPLTFVTGYYGTNLQRVVGTKKTEADFWKICGSIGLGIILVVSLYIFWRRLRANFRRPSEIMTLYDRSGFT